MPIQAAVRSLLDIELRMSTHYKDNIIWLLFDYNLTVYSLMGEITLQSDGELGQIFK